MLLRAKTKNRSTLKKPRTRGAEIYARPEIYVSDLIHRGSPMNAQKNQVGYWNGKKMEMIVTENAQI